MDSAATISAPAGSKQRSRQLVKRLGVNRLRWIRKAQIVRGYDGSVARHLSYVLLDPELENFTYDIANRAELAEWLDRLCQAGAYVRELEEDETLQRELRMRVRWRPASKRRPLFGRRAGWYALVRALRPRRVVETGMHDGLGSTALLAALERNGLGTLVSIDPKPAAGWLVPPRLRERWTPVRATSYEALGSAGPIDLFVHDSLHIPECERWELETAAELGARVLVSDNAHAAPTCAEFAASRNAAYGVWRERVSRHFYPGAGIGVVLLDRLPNSL